MVNIVHPILTLLASLTRQELAQQIRFLKAENEILTVQDTGPRDAGQS